MISFVLFLLAILGLSLARTNIIWATVALVCYFLLVYWTYIRKDLASLIMATTLPALVLAFRFQYLTWGDPWYEYAMELNILRHGTISPDLYPAQQPALHTLIAALSTYTKIAPMMLQKFVAPAASCISILAIYKIAKDFFDQETAFSGALLLSVGTAYLHWTSQAVRESLGIPMALLGFYVAYRSLKDRRYLPLALVLLAGLVLTHHLSALIFLIWWNSFALSYLYLVSTDYKEIATAYFISLFSLATASLWWMYRLPSTFETVKIAASDLFHWDGGFYLVFVLLGGLYALPAIFPSTLVVIRQSLDHVLSKREIIHLGVTCLLIIFALLALNFLLGGSFFVLRYPPTFFINGLIMLSLAVIGLRSLLHLDRIPLLAWTGGVSLMFVGSISGLYYSDDPLRFIEFIYPPLSVVSGAGFAALASNLKMRYGALVLGLICLISLVTAFPPTVFWGQEFPPGDLRYDPRALVISHPASEIMAIEYLGDYNAQGRLHTDRYISYAALHLDKLSVDLSFKDRSERFKDLNRRKNLDPLAFPEGNNFVLITERMKRYAEFGEWLMEEKHPLSQEEISKIEGNTSRIYDNGESWIYKGR